MPTPLAGALTRTGFNNRNKGRGLQNQYDLAQRMFTGPMNSMHPMYQDRYGNAGCYQHGDGWPVGVQNGIMPYDPMTAAFQQMLSGGLDGHHNHEGLRGGNSNGVDPLQLFESMGLYSPRRPRGMGPSGQDLLELLASGSRPRPRGIDPLSQGLLEILANGGQRHHPVDVIVEHRHSPRRGRRPKNYRSYDRGSAYYPSDDTEYYGSEIDDDYDTRSYVRRRPRHHYSHSHSRRRAWSPSYRDLDGFGFWSRGRPRHRIHFGTARDGSYTDREFTLR